MISKYSSVDTGSLKSKISSAQSNMSSYVNQISSVYKDIYNKDNLNTKLSVPLCDAVLGLVSGNSTLEGNTTNVKKLLSNLSSVCSYIDAIKSLEGDITSLERRRYRTVSTTRTVTVEDTEIYVTKKGKAMSRPVVREETITEYETVEDYSVVSQINSKTQKIREYEKSIASLL